MGQAGGCVFALTQFALPLMAQRSRNDSLETQNNVTTAIVRFFDVWGAAWKASEGERHRLALSATEWDDRLNAIHCHFSSSPRTHLYGADVVIRSSRSFFAVCPSYSDFGNAFRDEREGIDFALTASHREDIRAARSRLLATIDSAVMRYPGSDFMVGQRIRFLVDQQDFDHAIEAASQCRATLWWCAALGGFALAHDGQTASADSAFKLAVASQSGTARCHWSDISLVLEGAARRHYQRARCTQRDSLSDRFFWLADPLLSVDGNDRRVEQFVRKTMLALRAALERDERYDWHDMNGSDARAEMIERYGWPSYVYWAGPIVDAEHTGWLGSPKQASSPPNDPYTTYEYARDRQRLLPNWTITENPFNASATDLAVEVTPAVSGDRFDAARKWWPLEHYAPPYRLLNLPEGQTAFLRRDTTVILAQANYLDPKTLPVPLNTQIKGVRLVASPLPDSVVTVAKGDALTGSVLVLKGQMRTFPALIGIETLQRIGGNVWGARSRMGATPPVNLSALKAGMIGVSDPIILRAGFDGDLPYSPDSAMSLMAGSTRVNISDRVGVYWETYGIGAADSAEILVRIVRRTKQGILRTIGIGMKIATDLNTPIAISWTEAQFGERGHVPSGMVPITGRSLRLDISRLIPGEYWLEVAVQKAGHESVRGHRAFEIIQ
jgi:hypothetical protein